MSAKKIMDLLEGDMIDLAGDPYADLNEDDASAEFEYAVVDSIEIETADCIRVDFANRESCGFPPDHVVKVQS